MNAAVVFSMMVAVFLCSGNAWAEEYTFSQIEKTGMCSPTRAAKVTDVPSVDGSRPVKVYDCYESKSELLAPPKVSTSISPPRVEDESYVTRKNRHILVVDDRFRLCSPVFVGGATEGTFGMICSQDEGHKLLTNPRDIRNRLWNNLVACIKVEGQSGQVGWFDLVDESNDQIAAQRGQTARSNRIAFDNPVTLVPNEQCRVNQVARVKKPGKTVVARTSGAATKKPGPRRATRR